MIQTINILGLDSAKTVRTVNATLIDKDTVRITASDNTEIQLSWAQFCKVIDMIAQTRKSRSMSSVLLDFTNRDVIQPTVAREKR